jgi:hypothetical protein
MYIGLVNNWSPPYIDKRTGGINGGQKYLRDAINTMSDCEADCIYITDKKKPLKCWDSEYVYLNSPKDLNDYGFIIFSNPGGWRDNKEPRSRERWLRLLNEIKVPFAVQIQNELDLDVAAFPSDFLEHKLCKFVLPISEGLYKGDKKQMTFPVYPFHIDPLPDKFYHTKEHVITSTSRVTSRKRIKELVTMADKIVDAGWKIKVYGPESSYFYMRDVSLINTNLWSYMGLYTKDMIPKILSDATLHYNFVYLKHEQFFPRLEIATVEAVAQGCCPILCRESTPSFVNCSHALILGKNRLHKLPGILKHFTIDDAIERNGKMINYVNKQGKRLFHMLDTIELMT